jgi:hypothetical protein
VISTVLRPEVTISRWVASGRINGARREAWAREVASPATARTNSTTIMAIRRRNEPPLRSTQRSLKYSIDGCLGVPVHGGSTSQVLADRQAV